MLKQWKKLQEVTSFIGVGGKGNVPQKTGIQEASIFGDLGKRKREVIKEIVKAR